MKNVFQEQNFPVALGAVVIAILLFAAIAKQSNIDAKANNASVPEYYCGMTSTIRARMPENYYLSHGCVKTN